MGEMNMNVGNAQSAVVVKMGKVDSVGCEVLFICHGVVASCAIHLVCEQNVYMHMCNMTCNITVFTLVYLPSYTITSRATCLLTSTCACTSTHTYT